MSDTTAVHRHRVFDLNVVSWLALPASAGVTAAGPPEIVITMGEVPARLPDAIEEGFRRHVAPGRVLLCIDGVARYLIEDGRRITVARAPGADDDDVRTFLLGPAFGALLQQRGDFVLRASAVGREGVAVLLLGPPGVGKSSLAVELNRRGWTVLADDFAGVRADAAGRMVVAPGWNELKFWPTSLVPAAPWPRVRRGVEKRRLPLVPVGAGIWPLTRIYHLDAGGGDGGPDPVTGPRKLDLLNRHAYRPEFLVTPAARVEHQQLATRLAREVPITSLAAAEARENFSAWAEGRAAEISA